MREISEVSWWASVGLCLSLVSGPGCDGGHSQRWEIEPASNALSSGACTAPPLHLTTDNPRCPDGTYRGDIVLNDARISQLQGCVYIAGNVRLEASAPVSLHGLADLVCVSGDLTLGPDTGEGALQDLRGLSKLRAARALRIQNLPALTDLQGLSALEEVERLEVIGCDSLASLWGLDALRTIHGRLHLARNATLETLSGAPHLQALGELVVEDNASLESLLGMSRELSQLFSLRVERNASLLTLEGLEGLTQLQHLFVSDNPRLERLARFDNLRTLESFEVADHPRLIDLGALPAFEGNAQLELTLRNNTRLTSLHGLEHIAQAYNVEVSGNRELTDLSDWSIQQVHNFMLLSNNASLTTLDGLEPLRDVTYLRVQANPRLQELDGLSELQRSDGIEVRNNLALHGATPLRFQVERLTTP